MKVKIEGPLEFEATSIETKGNTIVAVPAMIKHQHRLKVAFLTAIGDGGRTAKAVVVFNANKGTFEIQNAAVEQTVFPFDQLTPVKPTSKKIDPLAVPNAEA